MNIVILQARMSSSRCPGKVMKPILGIPMLWHQWQRIKRAKCVDKVVLATSTDKSDDVLAQYFINKGESVFRGSLDDVLERYYQCAAHYQAKQIIRLTGDCPLIESEIIDKTVEKHCREKNDHTGIGKFPIGLSVEVCQFGALEKAHFAAKLRSQREHVTLYIYKRPEQFKLGVLFHPEDLTHHRWTVDHPEDFELVKRIYEALYPSKPEFNMHDVLLLLKQKPSWSSLNSHFVYNEGLIKSLKNDELVR